MVIVLWWLLECKLWQAEANRLLVEWPRRTGRRCPHCGERALVGHGRRKRTVHWGAEPGARWSVCKVLEFEVQRVRCRACGRCHTLLPGFVARYQRHPNRVRQEAWERREAGDSWSAVLRALRSLGVPLGTATSPRRWVAGMDARMGAALEGLQPRPQRPDGHPYYGSVAQAGSWTALKDQVRAAAAAAGWEPPRAGEELAAANRLGRGQWAL
jgi:hypothetical protein